MSTKTQLRHDWGHDVTKTVWNLGHSKWNTKIWTVTVTVLAEIAQIKLPVWFVTVFMAVADDERWWRMCLVYGLNSWKRACRMKEAPKTILFQVSRIMLTTKNTRVGKKPNRGSIRDSWMEWAESEVIFIDGLLDSGCQCYNAGVFCSVLGQDKKLNQKQNPQMDLNSQHYGEQLLSLLFDNAL